LLLRTRVGEINAVDTSTPESLTTAQKVFTMIGALLGLLLAALDQTIVATAAPKIQYELAITPSLYVWITTAYLVASTVLVPIYGKLSDLYGRRRILLVSIVIFLLGSLLCGMSQSAMQLIAFRAVQGIGSAGLFTIPSAVVADLFPPAERGKYQGLFGAAFALSSVIGPLVGGFITDNFGWHWAFFINLPIALIAIGMIVARMPPLRHSHAASPKLDVFGACALTIAAVSLLLALSLGHVAGTSQNGWTWTSWQILSLFGISAIGAIGFVLIERRASSPILDLAMFRTKTVAIGSIGAFVQGCAFLTAIVFLPPFMVNVVGLSATSTGLTTMPLTLGIAAANIMSGQLVSRLGSYKDILVGSGVILVGSFALLALTLDTSASQASVSAKMVLLGFGLGPTIPLFILAVQNAVPQERIGVATASTTFFRRLGMTVGVAIAGTMFATSFAASLQTGVPEATRDMPAAMHAEVEQLRHEGQGEGRSQVAFAADAVKKTIDDKLARLPLTPAEVAEIKTKAYASVDRVAAAFKQALTDALINVFWLSFVIALGGLGISMMLPQLPWRGDSKHRHR
jgi:EmrB/QacA subfamily drug resistance transporter